MKLVVRSRNKTCQPLKELEVPVYTIYRMGSTTPTEKITKRKNVLELNSPLGCEISGDKYKMGDHLSLVTKNTPETILLERIFDDWDSYKHCEWLQGKIIVKHIHSSGGKGIYIFDNIEELKNECLTWGEYKRTTHIVQKYYNYTKEYRLHISVDFGCFHAHRKLLKNDAEVRWHRHLDNCVFVDEDNPLFETPSCWNDIVKDCQRFMELTHLDIACFDVKVTKEGKNGSKYVILESNTAPGLGEKGIQKYKNIILKTVYERQKLNIEL